MSVKVSAAVWEDSVHRGSALVVMLALADHASDDGVAWPSLDRIAKYARITVRQTQAILEQLIGSGELFVLHGAGRSYANLYLVTIGHTPKTLAKVLEQRFRMPAEEARPLSYVILAKNSSEKVQPASPISLGKVKARAEKVKPSAEKVKPSAEKGEGGCTLTVINRQLTPSEPEEEPTVDEATLRAAETWDQVRNIMRLELPRSTFDERLRDTIGIQPGDDTFEVQCLSQDQADFLARRLHAKVTAALAAVVGRPITVEYTTRQAPRLLQ